MSANADAISNQTPPTGSHVASTAPLTTKGHQPGHIAGPKDAAPEFHAQTLPAGTAPAASTFKPNPINEVPGQSADTPAGEGEDGTGTTTSAADTLTGATSADVHTGSGHPGQGQSSKELHDNSTGGGSGLQGVGAEGAPAHGIDARDSKDFSQVGSHGASETKVPGQKNTQ